MKHKIKKENIFNFLKAESIIEEIGQQDDIEIIESKNINTDKLSKVQITSLTGDSKYWIINPENSTFLESMSKKVERIILEYTKDAILNIILLEMKSKSFLVSEVIEKFEKSLSWVYLLLNLLNDKENQDIRVYGILVAQKRKNWDEVDTLNIFTSTSIRYTKRSFFETSNETTIELQELTKSRSENAKNKNISK